MVILYYKKINQIKNILKQNNLLIFINHYKNINFEKKNIHKNNNKFKLHKLKTIIFLKQYSFKNITKNFLLHFYFKYLNICFSFNKVIYYQLNKLFLLINIKIFNFLALKLNNKLYLINQIKKIYSFNYYQKNKLIYKFIINNLKIKLKSK